MAKNKGSKQTIEEKKGSVEMQWTIEEVTKMLEGGASKSEMIRRLYDEGREVKEVADLVQVRRQFVDNVIRNRDGEVRRSKKVNKSAEMRKMFEEGMTVGEVAKELNENYNWVYAVRKKWVAKGGKVNDK